MNIYINPEKSPAAIQAKVSGSPISGLRLKRGANINLSVIVLGNTKASNLRFGVKAKGDYEGALLAYAEANNGITTDEGTRFELSLHVASVALNEAFAVGSGSVTAAASFPAVAEFAWQENGVERLSDTINTTLLNDIIRLATDAPEAATGKYPAPDLMATKAWVNSKQATADAAGFVMLGTNDTVSGKHVRPVGKNEDGGLAVDVSGLSAYDVAVRNGFIGTEEAWLASLKGERGAQGEPGKDADMEAIVNQAVAEVTSESSETRHAVTAIGTDNAEFLWCEVYAGHIPAGKLTSLAIQCRQGSSNLMSTAASYLGIWELDDAGNPVLLGVSSNAAVQTLGQATNWAFESIPLSGRTLRLCLLPTPDSDWLSGDLCFGARVSPCKDSCCMVMSNAQGYLPQIDFTYEVSLPRFAHVSHVSDEQLHLNPDDREKLNVIPANREDCMYAIFWTQDISGHPTKLTEILTEEDWNFLFSMSVHLSGSFALPLGEYAMLICRGNDSWHGNDLMLATNNCLTKFVYARYFNFPFGQ